MSRFTAEDLAVIIPTRGRWSILAKTLEGLARQTVTGFEIVVVVDGADDNGTVPALPGVRVIVQPHRGPAIARNVGVRAASVPLILLLGDDMLPVPTLIERHLDAHNREPEQHVAVLGQAVWHPDVRQDRLARWMDWDDVQFQYRLIKTDDAGFGRFYSSNVSIKREFFLGIGGFDEDFTIYYEDIDCGWRLNDHGLRLRYEPEALTDHLHRYDWPSIERRFAGIAKGERLMMRKHPEFEPWYSNIIRATRSEPRASLAWPLLVDWLPESAGRVRHWLERRAHVAYYQALAPAFLQSWHADQSLDELRIHLGPAFDEQALWQHHDLVEREEAAATDDLSFYRTSRAYLYDLTAFAMWDTKVPYREALRRSVPPGSRLLDYGCGIGSDGLWFLDDGYEVSFADFDNPSVEYLRWRLERRGLSAPVYDIEGELPTGFDAVYAFDVIEHVDDPWAFLGRLEDLADIVAVNFLEPDEADTHLHKPLPVDQLLDHAANMDLRFYRRYHARSHLVIYGTTRGGLRAQLRSRARRALGPYVRPLSLADLDRVERLRRQLRRSR